MRWSLVLLTVMLMTACFATGAYAGALAAFVTNVLGICLLSSEPALYESQRLDAELAGLKVQQAKVNNIQASFTMWAQKAERVQLLWRYHTMNLLDLFDTVSSIVPHGVSWDSSHDQTVLPRVVKLLRKLQAVSEGMGPVSAYLEANSSMKDLLQTVGEQARRNIDGIADATLQTTPDGDRPEMYPKIFTILDGFWGMLVVYVVGATKLPNMDEQMFSSSRTDLTDAFVIVRLGQTMNRKDAPRTRVIQDDLNPVWEERFFLETTTEVKSVNLEVFDCDEDQLVGPQSEGIGFVHVADIRASPGQWIQRIEFMQTMAHRKRMTSKLEFWLFFANKVEHLVALDKAEQPSGNEVRNLESFLAK